MEHNFTFYIYSKFDFICEPENVNNAWFRQNRLNFDVSLIHRKIHRKSTESNIYYAFF